MPTLIVWGDHDGIIPVAHGIAAHEAIASSRLEIIEGVGHFPHVEAPARFNEVLLDFLSTTAAGPISRRTAPRRPRPPTILTQRVDLVSGDGR